MVNDRYYMVGDLTAKDKADFQKFIDFSVQNRNAVRRGGERHQVHADVFLPEVGAARFAGAHTGCGGQIGEGGRRVGPADVTVRGLCKSFGNAAIYHDFDLDIPRGKLVSVFGPNGCGKSTLINMIAGLIPLDAGEILFDGKPLSQIKFGYVFQNYREALFPGCARSRTSSIRSS